MNIAGPTRARLFEVSNAFEHPVSRWILVAIGAALAMTPLVIFVLGSRGRVTPEHRRELWLRYRSWLILVPLMVGPILLGAAATMAGVLVLSLLCYREFARATGLFRETLTSAVVVIGIAAVGFATFDNWYGFFSAIPPLVITVIAAATILQDRPSGYIQRVGLGVLAFMLFGTGLGHLGYFANDQLYRPILLMLLATVELNDIFAYITGKLFGSRHMLPNTSPKKTLAGSLGSVLLTTPSVACLAHFIFRGETIDQPWTFIGLGLIVSIGGQLGDLMLSSVKRDIGVKDLGVLIPGHGGLLDRFDSLLLVAPAAFHFIKYFRGIAVGEATRIITGP